MGGTPHFSSFSNSHSYHFPHSCKLPQFKVNVTAECHWSQKSHITHKKQKGGSQVTKLETLCTCLSLEILSTKVMNANDDKGQPQWSPTPTGNESVLCYYNGCTKTGWPIKTDPEATSHRTPWGTSSIPHIITHTRVEQTPTHPRISSWP